MRLAGAISADIRRRCDRRSQPGLFFCTGLNAEPRPAAGERWVRVSKLWRMAAACTVTGSLLTAGGLPALAAAPAAPTITITATSQQVITGDVLVVYRARYKYAVATISGDISGTMPGNVVKLYAQRSPTTRPRELSRRRAPRRPIRSK